MINNSNINFKGRIFIYEGTNEIGSMETFKDKTIDKKMLDFIEDKFLKSPDVKLAENSDGRACLQVEDFKLSNCFGDIYFSRPLPALFVDLELNKDKPDKEKTTIRWEMLNFEGYPELIDKANALMKKAGEKITELTNKKKEEQIDINRGTKILMDSIRLFCSHGPNC